MDSITTFNKYLPPHTVAYCHSLWQEHRFKFIISPKRQTKLGDYRYVSGTGHHIVTVNGNLNPYSFLTTYLHEVAHLTTFKKFGNKVLPHGAEWKNEFRLLFVPLLKEAILPNDILLRLQDYLKNPRASSCSEQGLFEHSKDAEKPLKEGELLLKNLGYGEYFIFRNRTFTLLELKRTRFLCQEISTGRKYLIHQHAVVRIEPKLQWKRTN